MKIIKQDSYHLRLERRDTLPTIVLVVLGGLTLFFSSGILGLLYNMGARSIDCQRVESTVVNCKLRYSHFFGLINETKRLDGVRLVTLHTKDDKPSEMVIDSTSTRIVMKAGGAIEGGWGNVSALSESLNSVLSSKRPALTTFVDTQLGDYIFLIVSTSLIIFCWFFIYSLISVFFVVDIWDFDNSRDKIFYQRYSILDLLKIWRTKEDYLLREFTAIEVHNLQGSENSPSRYAIALIKGKQDYLRLPKYGIAELKTQQAIANRLENFLNLPVSLEPIILRESSEKDVIGKQIIGKYVVDVGVIPNTSMLLEVLSETDSAKQYLEIKNKILRSLQSMPNKSKEEKGLIYNLEKEIDSEKIIASQTINKKVLVIDLLYNSNSVNRIKIPEKELDIFCENLNHLALEVQTKSYLSKPQPTWQPTTTEEKLVMFLATEILPSSPGDYERFYLGTLEGNNSPVVVLHPRKASIKGALEIDEEWFPMDILDRILERISPCVQDEN